jgi:hypothetical protein
MGIFDSLICKYPLPDPEAQGVVFQTKSLGPSMLLYTITEDGELFVRKERWEDVPEEERPYYGKPEWYGEHAGLYRAIGSTKPIYEGEEKVNFHGVVNFYHYEDDVWYEYNAKFTDGRLVSLVKVEDQA